MFDIKAVIKRNIIGRDEYDSMETDFVISLIPSVIAIIVTFIVLGIKKVGATADTSIVGSTEIRHIHETLAEIKERIDKLYDKMDSTESDLKLHSYRLDKYERNSNNK